LAAIGPPRESISVVPNGIDIEQINNAQSPTEGYDILFAGRLIEHKNVDILLQAFDQIAETYNVSLGVIGDGPERDNLETQAESLNHTKAVDFLGFLEEYEDVLGHMRAAEMFVSPSTREGFGLTFAEAMAADCTVIAADHPDSAADEVIGDAGFLVEPTATALQSRLASALDGERPDKNPCHRAAEFDWEAVTDQALSVYTSAVKPQ
jgi:glycosyltransferase involved in cell wall biosynthesis